jgi:hypothetical protein
MIFSADETVNVGIELGKPVIEAIGAEAKSRFTGQVPKVTLEVRDVNPKAEAAVKQGQQELRQRAR